MQKLPSLREARTEGRRAFVRVDFNVPIHEGQITDDRRIRAAIPTIEYLLAGNSAVVLCSHLGRPKEGTADPKYSLQPIRAYLEKLLRRPVGWIPEPSQLFPVSVGSVYLMENIRFFRGESQNDIEFARTLAHWADFYVNDAFGSVHRAHASVEALPRLLREKYAGFLVEAEWENARRVLTTIESPYLVVIGGAKVSDKLPILRHLLPKLDRLFIGGGMSYTFLKAMNLPIGKSICEEEQLEAARDILSTAQKAGKQVLLPKDSVAATAFQADAKAGIFPHVPDGFPDNYMGLDIGPATIEAARSLIQGSRTILWNGPMGVFEWEAFREGTMKIAELLAKETARGAYTLVGGGDTASAAEMASVADKMSFISTGGGALLELLAGQELPGITALLS
ncbi:MAG: phosphoglycerate kinase [Bacteroidia bacterium]|nr:phosphoglycerate kinase [Bacteroidia bacterium]MDW8134923.1 phosphoglycerate kinase [Bacteroidia bacterium]